MGTSLQSFKDDVEAVSIPVLEDGDESLINLLRNELMFHKVFEKSNNAILVVDADHSKLADCNPLALQMFGYKSKDIFKAAWGKGIHTASYDERQLEHFFHALELTGNFSDEIEIERADGEKIWATLQVSQYRFKGQKTHLIRMTNATNRYQNEKRLREQEELFKLVTQATNDGIFSYDTNLDVTWVNQEYIEMFGYGAEDTINHNNSWFIEKLHPDDRNKTQKTLENIRFSDRNQLFLEYRFRHKDGHYMHVMDRGFIIRNEYGQAAKVVGAITDLSAIRQKEMALEESELKLRSILNTVEEVVFSLQIDKSGKMSFDFFSKSSGETWGYHPEEILENKYLWYKNILQEDRLNIIGPAFTKLSKLKPVEIEYRFKHKNGQIVWISSRMIPMQSPDGTIRVTGTAIDITGQKLAMERLKLQNDELMKANMELDKFVYSASHDLRAPLTSIMGLVNLFSTETDNPEQLGYLKMIDTSINRLDKFISNIVDYSRNTRMEVIYEPIDFETIINESFEAHQYIEGFPSIQKSINISHDSIFFGDPTRIGMILNNLISNAIKYQKPNFSGNLINITIDITDTTARIEVKDNGVGIGQQNITKVFDMFYTAATNNRGSGIGLYIVKETVMKLGGKVWVESQPPNGSTFTVVLPNHI